MEPARYRVEIFRTKRRKESFSRSRVNFPCFLRLSILIPIPSFRLTFIIRKLSRIPCSCYINSLDDFIEVYSGRLHELLDFEKVKLRASRANFFFWGYSSLRAISAIWQGRERSLHSSISDLRENSIIIRLLNGEETRHRIQSMAGRSFFSAKQSIALGAHTATGRVGKAFKSSVSNLSCFFTERLDCEAAQIFMRSRSHTNSTLYPEA